MSTYHRIRYTPEGGQGRTLYVKDLKRIGPRFHATEVDREGAAVGRVHVISRVLVSKVTQLYMDNHYGELTETAPPTPEWQKAYK